MGNNVKRITKQKWYEVEGGKKLEVFKEKKDNCTVEYYYKGTGDEKTIINITDLKKQYTKRRYAYSASKIFHSDSKNQVKNKGEVSLIKCTSQNDKKGKEKRKTYKNHGLLLYVWSDGELNEFDEKIMIKKNDKIYRTFYPNEEDLIIKRKEFKIELNEFFGCFNKGSKIDSRKLKCKNDKLNKKQINELIQILGKYKESELVDLNNKNAQTLKKYVKSQLRNEDYKDIVNIMVDFILNKDEKKFEESLNNHFYFLGRYVDRNLNASFETAYSKTDKKVLKNKKEKINRADELRKLSEVDIETRNKLINDILENSYKLTVLLENLKKNKNTNSIKYIIKNHYKDNVNLLKDGEDVNVEKFILMNIHNYVKGRFKKYKLSCNSYKGNNIDFINKKVLKLEKLEVKIINSIENKVINYKISHKEKKEIRKMDESLKVKLINPINEYIYMGLKKVKLENKKIVKDYDTLFSVENINKFEECLKDGINKFKEYFPDASEEEIKSQLKYIYILRNYLLHNQPFGKNNGNDELQEINYKPVNLIDKEKINAYEYQVLRDNNILNTLELELIHEYIDNKSMQNIKNTYLPRFQKVYKVCINNITGFDKITEQQEQAIKYIWSKLYLEFFEEKILSLEKLSEIYTNEFKDCLSGFTSLKNTREEIQRIFSTNEEKLRKYENRYVQFVGKLFVEYIKISNYSIEAFEYDDNKINEEDENIVKEKISSKVEEYLKDLDVDSDYLKSIISISFYISNDLLNKLINDLAKFKQFYIYLIEKYNDAEIENYFIDKNISGITVENIENTINIMELILKSNDINNINLLKDNHAVEFDYNIKLLDVYNFNLTENERFKEDKDVYYEYQCEEEAGKAKQEIIKAGDKEINFKFLIEETKRGYLYKTLNLHEDYLRENEGNYKEYLNRYTKYYLKDEVDKKTLIEKLQKEKQEKYIELSEKIHQKYMDLSEGGNREKELKDKLASLSDEVNEYISKYNSVQEYDFLKNLIYLKSITKALRLQKELYTRMMSWMYIYERDTKMFINDDSKLDKPKLMELREQKSNQVKNNNEILKFRNEIMHLNYFTSIFEGGEIKNINNRTLVDLFHEFREIENYSTVRFNDVKVVFANILEKFNIIINYNGKEINELMLSDFERKAHTKFNSKVCTEFDNVFLISEEEMEYLLFFIGIKK